MATLKTEIKKNKSRVFRKAFVKRRDATTGLFESTWQEITSDVKKWGKIKASVDAIRPNKIEFGSFNLRVANDEGKYNPEDDSASLWNGYANRQRSLLKIEAGFLHQTLSSSGIWTNTEFPTSTTLFTGLLHGDMFVSDKNEVSLNARPLLEIFREFPARNLTGYTSTGLSASQFIEVLRDQTDGAGEFIFRPFFGDTTTNWDIQTTTIIYANLNTSTAEDVNDLNVWEVVEKLSEAEQFIPYIDGAGVFHFKDKTQANTTGSQFSFYGLGSHDTEFGHTIKRIKSYGKKHTRYYSRVSVHWFDSKTATSYEIKESTLLVSGSNDAWNLGLRTLDFENFWINTSTVANSIAAQLFNEFSAFRNEISFNSSFVPQLEILDRIDITYNSPGANPRFNWDMRNWAADDTAVSDDLIWDASIGDAIKLVNKEFKILSVELDIDKFSTDIMAREL